MPCRQTPASCARSVGHASRSAECGVPKWFNNLSACRLHERAARDPEPPAQEAEHQAAGKARRFQGQHSAMIACCLQTAGPAHGWRAPCVVARCRCSVPARRLCTRCFTTMQSGAQGTFQPSHRHAASCHLYRRRGRCANDRSSSSTRACPSSRRADCRTVTQQT